ncbi:MAG: helix-hairpin-helix domain-containing protein [Coprobacillus sp.]|nr:helix-hairpin-helix domain-containing protein [Coprobacillus sp.]
MLKTIIIVFVVAAVAICGFLVVDSVTVGSGVSSAVVDDLEGSLYITIEGQIKNAGTYSFSSEDVTMKDLIKAAGGVTDIADSRAYYESAELVGGGCYYIPSMYDESDYCNISAISKVNLNTGDSTELSQLSGVGSSTAEKIIDYREENGDFMTIESIVNVSGIGDSLYNKIRDNVILHE